MCSHLGSSRSSCSLQDSLGVKCLTHIGLQDIVIFFDVEFYKVLHMSSLQHFILMKAFIFNISQLSRSMHFW